MVGHWAPDGGRRTPDAGKKIVDPVLGRPRGPRLEAGGVNHPQVCAGRGSGAEALAQRTELLAQLRRDAVTELGEELLGEVGLGKP